MRAWLGLGVSALLGCEPQVASCEDGVRDVGVYCLPDDEILRFGRGFAPTSMVALDLDGDGALDIAASNPDRQTVSVGWGGPGGGVERLTSWPLAQDVAGLAHGDLDGDGRLDLAAALPGSDSVVVLHNRGGREFELRRHPAGSSPRALLAVDLDGAGRAALVTANLGDGSLSVLRDGVVEPPIVVGRGPLGLAAGDLDGDGANDLAVGLRDEGVVQVLRNAGGALLAGARLPVGAAPAALVIADLDEDGALDLASADELGESVSVIHGDGAGGARKIHQWPVSGRPLALAVVRGGGLPPALGVLSGETSTAWLLDPRTGAAAVASTEASAGAIAAADTDRDGRQELIYGAQEAGRVAGLRAAEGVRMAAVGRVDGVNVLGAADGDGDGVDELVVESDSDGPTRLFWLDPGSTGDPGRRIHTRLEFVAGCTGVDLDGDGLAAPVCWGSIADGPGALEIYVEAAGALQVRDSIEFGEAYMSGLVAGDVGGDGDLDLLLIGRTLAESGALWLVPGAGDGTLGAAVPITSVVLNDLTALDLDGDAALDLVAHAPGALLVYTDIGPGVVPVVRPIPLEFDASVAGDIDGDGADELLLGGWGLARLDPLDPFAPLLSVLESGPTHPLALRDLDGDGDLDALAVVQEDYQTNGPGRRLSLGVFVGDGPGGLELRGRTDIDALYGDPVVFEVGGGDLGLAVDQPGRAALLRSEPGDVLVERALGGLAVDGVGALADLDGDGRTDWVGVDRDTVALGMGYELGLGPTRYTAIAALFEPDVLELNAMAVADLEGDGVDEVVTLGAVDSPGIALRSLAVLRLGDDGEPRVLPLARFVSGGRGAGLAARDLDGDAKVDLLLIEPELESLGLIFLRGRGDGEFEPGRTQRLLGTTMTVLGLAGVDADPHLDLVVETRAGHFFASGSDGGSFGPLQTWRPRNELQYGLGEQANLADVDGDGRSDLVVGTWRGLLMYSGALAGAAAPPRRLHASLLVQAFAAFDLDGDGVHELQVLTPGVDGQKLWQGRGVDGKYVFRERSLPGLVPDPKALALAARDLDGDGALDLVVLGDRELTIVRQRP